MIIVPIPRLQALSDMLLNDTITDTENGLLHCGIDISEPGRLDGKDSTCTVFLITVLCLDGACR
jgi:hypothetical protein